MNKSKTVWDAVNELRGEINKSGGYFGGEIFLYYDISSDKDNWIAFRTHVNLTNINYKYIATVAEFKALVEEMKTGLDVNPTSIFEFLDYRDSNKTLLQPSGEIYTQAMAAHVRNTKLLSNLTDFLVKNSIGKAGESAVDVAIRELSEKHNIDKRTDKEKLFDEVNSIPRIFNSDALEFCQKIIDGKITGVKWTGE